MNKAMFHYECLNEFKHQYYKDLLTQEHLTGGQIKIDTLHYPDGGSVDDRNFWGYQFKKNNVKYLLSSRDESDNEIDIKTILPLRAKGLQKVASNGIVYQEITEPIAMRFRPHKSTSFKELVNLLSSLNHSNNKQQIIMTLLGLSSVYYRVYYRVSSPPGFGKDSIVDILGHLLGNAGTIENPTVPKLEERATVLKWLAINEVIDITPSQWREIEQILLSMGAFKPSVTKRSKAHKSVGEVIDVSNFSLSIMYNDIDCYPNPKKYFDYVTKDAVKDRFPAFRFHGTLNEDFNVLVPKDIPLNVGSNIEEYVKLIKNILYYKENQQLHGYIIPDLGNIPERWKTSIFKLLQLVDMYSDDQDEFDTWVHEIRLTMLDYKVMLEYPELLEKLSKKLVEKEYKNEWERIKMKPTFLQKKDYIMSLISSDRVYKDVSAEQFWD